MGEEVKELIYQVTSADNHIKSRDARIAQTPKTGVLWSGEAGASRCYPMDSKSQKALEQYGQRCVRYNSSGEPDFSPFAEVKVKISNMGSDRQKNFSSAGKKLLETDWAKENNIQNLSQLEQYRQDHHLTWHECGDGVEMQLVPSKINARFGHSGGVAEHAAIDIPVDKSEGALRSANKEAAKIKVRAKQKMVKFQDSTVGAAVETGIQTSLVTITVSGINNLAAVAKGDKDIETAAADVVNDAAQSFVAGTGVYLAQDALKGIANKIGNETLKNIAIAKIPVTEIALALMVKDQMTQYLNGTVSAEDCAINILLNGAGTLAYQMGMAVGGPAGAIITSIVVTQISQSIIEYRQKQKIEKAREIELNRVLCHATAEIARQRDALNDCVQTELKRWDDTIKGGFDKILQSALADNSDGVAAGLNDILELFGQYVPYTNRESFDRDFYDPASPPLNL